jgi:hypothetical protein
MDILKNLALYVVAVCAMSILVLLGLSRIARAKPRLGRFARGGSIILYTIAVVIAALLGITDRWSPSGGWFDGLAGFLSACMVGLPWNLPLVCLAKLLLQLAGYSLDGRLQDTLIFWISWCGAGINTVIVAQSVKQRAWRS